MTEILVSANQALTRIALVEDGVLRELMIEQAQARSRVGDIYLGKVSRVMPGMDAAFVDLGTERAGFIHASDISAIDSEGLEVRQEGLPIGDLVREGQYLLVQIVKDEISGKGARLSNHLTLPGRHLVLLPRSTHVGVSQKIVNEAERERLQQLLEESLSCSDWQGQDVGFIVRTAAAGAELGDFEEDLGHLYRLWMKLTQRLQRPASVRCIYSEEPIVVRATRDLINPSVSKIRVDDEDVFSQLCAFFEDTIPHAVALTQLVSADEGLFSASAGPKGSIDQQIAAALRKTVDLPSGGNVVIEQTESMVTIDVNTGSYLGSRDQAATILTTNIEAAVAVAQQLRLRNLGGLIVIDFIDMAQTSHQEEVRQALLNELSQDPARTAVGRFSEFGLVEMTRKRSRESLQRLLLTECEHCQGAGVISSSEFAPC